MSAKKVNKQTNQQITNFFPLQKKELNISNFNKETKKTNIAIQFYERCAAEKRLEKCNEECLLLKSNLQQQISTMNSKLKKIEQAREVCLKVVAEKDRTIDELQIKLNGMTKIETKNTRSQPESLFDKYSQHFSSNELAKLRSTGGKIYEDSTFILEAVKCIYGKNICQLENKSVTGRGKSKEPVTPEKMKILEGIFSTRFDSLNLKLEERVAREKKLNFHIKAAISNIKTSAATKQMKEEISSRITSMNLQQN